MLEKLVEFMKSESCLSRYHVEVSHVAPHNIDVGLWVFVSFSEEKVSVQNTAPMMLATDKKLNVEVLVVGEHQVPPEELTGIGAVVKRFLKKAESITAWELIGSTSNLDESGSVLVQRGLLEFKVQEIVSGLDREEGVLFDLRRSLCLLIQ